LSGKPGKVRKKLEKSQGNSCGYSVYLENAEPQDVEFAAVLPWKDKSELLTWEAESANFRFSDCNEEFFTSFKNVSVDSRSTRHQFVELG
jgi:endonuclease I